MRATRARRALGPYRPRAPEGRRPKGAARVPGPGTSFPPLVTDHIIVFFSVRRYTGDRPQVCLVLCCCLLSFQPRTFEPLYKYRLVGQIPPITPCFADVHRFGRLAAAVRRQSALFSCRTTSPSRGSTNSHPSLLPCHTPGMYWRDQCPPGMSFQLDIWFVWFCASSPNVHR